MLCTLLELISWATLCTSLLGCFEGPESCFASASSDGTVAISHYNPSIGWGVMEEDNQFLLFQRCVGMGALDYGHMDVTNQHDARRYVVCCLRGGTMYLVPVAEQHALSTPKDSVDQNIISMFSVPVDPNDGDDDGLVRLVQNFTAGMARVMCWKDLWSSERSQMTGSCSSDGTKMKSVAMVGWPAGIVDVYEVAPPESIRDANDALFREIVDEGVAVKLVKLLLEIERKHTLLSTELWCKAWDECHCTNDLDAILHGIKETNNFAAIRSLLLDLASQKYNNV